MEDSIPKTAALPPVVTPGDDSLPAGHTIICTPALPPVVTQSDPSLSATAPIPSIGSASNA